MDLYWKRVEACLIEFHQFCIDDAMTEGKRARSVFTDPIDGFPADEDAIEHIDPFYMACDIAKRKLDIQDHFDQYQALLKVTRLLYS